MKEKEKKILCFVFISVILLVFLFLYNKEAFSVGGQTAEEREAVEVALDASMILEETTQIIQNQLDYPGNTMTRFLEGYKNPDGRSTQTLEDDLINLFKSNNTIKALFKQKFGKNGRNTMKKVLENIMPSIAETKKTEIDIEKEQRKNEIRLLSNLSSEDLQKYVIKEKEKLKITLNGATNPQNREAVIILAQKHTNMIRSAMDKKIRRAEMADALVQEERRALRTQSTESEFASLPRTTVSQRLADLEMARTLSRSPPPRPQGMGSGSLLATNGQPSSSSISRTQSPSAPGKLNMAKYSKLADLRLKGPSNVKPSGLFQPGTGTYSSQPNTVKPTLGEGEKLIGIAAGRPRIGHRKLPGRRRRRNG